MRAQELLNRLQSDYGVTPLTIIKEVQRYLPAFNDRKFLKAFAFAAEAHDGQSRKDGKPYITHPYETVRILTAMHVDEDTLIAALLHDVPEDTRHPITEIETRFGKHVAYLVEGITKLSKVHYQHDMEKRQVESLKKLFIHTATDPRIILIKLADRLHNMRTLHYISKPEKRVRIAHETLEIFVPIANLLGIEEMKSELEDLCFKHLYPEEFELIADRMKVNRQQNTLTTDETVRLVEKELKKQRINATVYSRNRNLYSIYKRISNETNRLTDFDKLVTLRILVDDKSDCYRTLGVLHAMFKPRPGKFKDYIAVPKKNGYQSLHTTVFGINGITTEFQIRTHAMHLEAEYGIAASYFGRNEKRLHLEEDRRADWAQKIMDIQMIEQSEEGRRFMDDLKHDILHDRIFVFTPKGDSVDLPKDATCIDFAYEIHTEVGHRALKAEVNGAILPLTTRLHNGDTVHIITSDVGKGPSRTWLDFIKTNTARNAVLNHFKKISQEEKLMSGRSLLQKDLDRAGLGLVSNISQKKIRAYCGRTQNCRNLDDILIAIGEGALHPVDFIGEIFDTGNGILTSKVQKSGNGDAVHPGKTKVALKIVSNDSAGQLGKILGVFDDMHIDASKTVAYISFWKRRYICKTNILVDSFSQVSTLCQYLEQVEGVQRVERLFLFRKLLFFIGITVTFVIWAAHPYFLHFVSTTFVDGSRPIVSSIALYTGIFMLFIMVFLLKSLTQRSFPELRETSAFWGVMFVLSTFALITLFAEIYFFNLMFNWVMVLGLILLIFAYLTAEYINYRERIKNPP